MSERTRQPLVTDGVDAGRWRMLAVIGLAELLALAPWFGASAVAPNIVAAWDLGGLDLPTEGEVTVQGIHLDDLTRTEQARLRNTCVGYIFQSYNLVPVMTALQNVALPILLGGMDVPDASKKARELLTAVGLGERTHHRPDELSGGQQQRVAVARAVVSGPSLVLADEPTANLDSKHGEMLLELMRKMNEDHGVTFIIATHEQLVMDFAKRLIRLHDGRLVSDEMTQSL